MKMRAETRKLAVAAALVALAAAASAFEAIPMASAKALGVTKSRPFTAGLVFVNGKYIEPPYVVERWGTGIRINSQQVTGQVVDWSEFLKTQDPSRLTKNAAPAPEPPKVSAPPPPAYTQSDADALDDLFDDDPKPKKSSSPVQTQWRPSTPRAKPQAAPTYVLDGDFVKNEASKALVKRINDQRTEIDGILRRGGFIFFGDGYSRVSGDSRTADTMLASLPELMQHAVELNAFRHSIRAARMVYLNEILVAQLFQNRVDYRRLQERRTKIQKDREWEAILNDAGRSVL